MKNIWTIFRRDLQQIQKNVIAMIVIIGITVVPCLYAWFNIAASWDPYENTGNLKVAVASVDKGYEGTLIPLQITLGDQVLSALRENTQLEWIFTTKAKALKGVKSGKYYAAIVIPEDFSQNMMSIFSSDIQKPEITYYSNAKENAIAPKVTDKGATAIQTQVNEVFIETISDTALTALQAISETADQQGASEIVGNLITNLDKIQTDLTTASGTLQSFSQMTASAGQLLDTTTAFLQQTQEQAEENTEALKKSKQSFSGLKETVSGTTDSINRALTSSKGFYDQMSSTLDAAFQTQSTDASAVSDTLTLLAGRVDQVITSYTALRDSIAEIGEEHEQLASITGALVAKLDASITTQTELRDKFNHAASSLTSAVSDTTGDKKELDDLIRRSASEIAGVASDYETSVQAQLNQLLSSVDTTRSDISGLLTQLDSGMDGITKLADSAGSDLADIQTTLDDSCSLLTKASEKLEKTIGKLTKMQKSGDFSQLEAMLGGDSESISLFLSAPVSLKTNAIYPIENYGSAMAPFYSTLSIWIGGIVLVAMLKVTVSKNRLDGLQNVKLHQMYLGRYLIFLIVGLLQSSLICLGDLFYLEIQCQHPFLFLLAGWVSSVVYVNIIYTLTVSFGDIGKAISVVLLVVQVAGTGGTFPIEVAPGFFRAVYPLLPFTHSMAALREAVGGVYGMDYWMDLGKLGLFLVVSLIVGLVLRRPIIQANDRFTEKLEETKII